MKNDFQMGVVLASAQVKNNLQNKDFNLFIDKCIRRHLSKDWGDLEDEDIEANFHALEHNQRVLSSYKLENLKDKLNLPNDKIWIITEYDRQTSTILFPSEY